MRAVLSRGDDQVEEQVYQQRLQKELAGLAGKRTSYSSFFALSCALITWEQWFGRATLSPGGLCCTVVLPQLYVCHMQAGKIKLWIIHVQNWLVFNMA